MMLVRIQVPDWRDDLAGKVLVLPSTHVKMSDVAACICHPRMGEVEVGGHLKFTGQPVWPTCAFQASDSPCLKIGSQRAGGLNC